MMEKIKKRTLATLFIFSALALLPVSCGFLCNDTCGCGPQFEVKDFNILSFETLTLTKAGQRVNPSTPLPYQEVFKAFRILETRTIAFSDSGSGIPGIAYACDPQPPKSAEQMKGIQILNTKEVTLGDGNQLKVGDDITSYFEINYFFSESTVPIDAFFIAPVQVYREDLFKLGFKKNPGKEIELEFSLRIFFTGGKEFNLNNEILAIR